MAHCWARLVGMAAAALKILERQFARRLGADGVHGRVDLHARRDADGHGLLAKGGIDVARGTVSAGEEDEVCVLHRKGGAAGIVRRRFRPRLIDALSMGEAPAFDERSAHLPACAEDRQLLFHRQKLAQRDRRALPGMTDGAEAGGFRRHAVGALESDAAAHPCNGIYDQP